MKILFYVLSLLVIIGAAYFSNSNKQKLIEQQEFRVSTIGKNETVSAQADKTEAQLTVERTKLKEAREAKAEVEQTIASLESQQRELQRELREIEATREAQLEKLEDARKAMEELKRVFADMGFEGEVNLENFERNFNMLEDKRKVLTAEIAELETNISGAEKSVDRNRAEIIRLGQRKETRDERIARNARESIITAVDPDWGFVVIGAGRNSGFEPQGRLIVKRDGRAIAQIVPSSIESTQTIAEIDYDTVSPGVVLQPGDRVMRIKPAAD